MDINFFQALDECVDKAPAEMRGYIQIHNVSGSIIPVVEGWYLRTFKAAFVHPDNAKVQKLIKLRRVRVVPFELEKPIKSKKTKQIPEEPSEDVKKITELDMLENMFSNSLNKEAGE
jgi:hypothetical protein